MQTRKAGVLTAVLATALICVPLGFFLAPDKPWTEHQPEWALVFFTAALTLTTAALVAATYRLATGGEETARQSMRAYVSVSVGKLDNSYPALASGTQAPMPAFAIFALKNAGRTPAYSVEISLKAWSRLSLASYGSQQKPVETLTDFVTEIPGDGGSHRVMFKLTQGQLHTLGLAVAPGREDTAILEGTLKYLTVFDQTRDERFIREFETRISKNLQGFRHLRKMVDKSAKSP